MAAHAGKDFLIQVNTVSTTYVTVAGMRSPRLSINDEMVDITNADSAGRWRELLAGAGVRSVTVSGAGVFKDDTGANKVEELARTGAFATMKVVVPDYGTFAGDFQISPFEFTGEHNGAVMFSATFNSSGEITFTAA